MRSVFPVSFMRQILLACICVALGSVCQAEAKENPAKEVSIQEAARLIESKPANLLILDVRTPAEFSEGHIANARNMDFFGGRFDQDIQNLPRDKTILLYCRTGRRSAGAVEALQAAGHTEILHMHEGLESWQKAGLPVVKD